MNDTDLTWQQKVAALAVQFGRAPTVEELIELNRGHKMLDEEWDAQRDSFVRGQVEMGSDRDEARYRDKLVAKGTPESENPDKKRDG